MTHLRRHCIAYYYYSQFLELFQQIDTKSKQWKGGKKTRYLNRIEHTLTQTFVRLVSMCQVRKEERKKETGCVRGQNPYKVVFIRFYIITAPLLARSSSLAQSNQRKRVLLSLSRISSEFFFTIRTAALPCL